MIKKFFYIGGIIISGLSIFGFGDFIPKLTQNIKEQNKINFENKFFKEQNLKIDTFL